MVDGWITCFSLKVVLSPVFLVDAVQFLPGSCATDCVSMQVFVNDCE